MPVSGEVAIVGAGVTRFGVLHEMSYLDLIAEFLKLVNGRRSIHIGRNQIGSLPAFSQKNGKFSGCRGFARALQTG